VPLQFDDGGTVEQKNKIQIIMNLFAPPGAWLNNAINDLAIKQAVMSRDRKFGYTVVKCGDNSRMWKLDRVNAHNNVAVSLNNLRLQFFSNTLSTIAIVISCIPL
jgi:hypothetical protein